MLEMGFGNLLDKAFGKYGDSVAFKIDGREYTYREVEDRVNRLANGFRSLGLETGDRIVIMMTNCIEYLFADYAAAKAGLVMVPLNAMLTRKDIEFRIRNSEARAVVMDYYFYKTHGLFFGDIASVQRVICVFGNGMEMPDNVISFYGLIEVSSPVFLDPGITQDALRAIMYTGGTTGEPKGVMHTHKSYVSIIYSALVEFDINEGEVMLQTAPLAHAAGFLVPPCLLRGGKVIITNGYNPAEVFKLIQEEKVTWTFMVPTMIYAFLDHPKRKEYDLSSLRTVAYGAAPISPRRLEEVLRVMGPIFIQGYSQMEVANTTITFTKKQHLDALESGRLERLKSCGMPVLISRVKIVDDEGREVKEGGTGELITRGPHMMEGYWRREKETSEAIIDGWLHTGDVVRKDGDGFFYLVDRKKDMIISGGMNVYSTEVESVLSQHPAVAECSVIGIPDDKWGELVLGIIVRSPGVDVDEKELLRFCRDSLTVYKRPKKIEFYESLPRTVYGKIDKKTIRDKYWAGQDRMI